MPALPLDEAGKYVAGAYIVFLALVLIYVAIMAARLQRVERELGDLADLAEGRTQGRPAADPAGRQSGGGNVRGEAEDQMFVRETSTRQEEIHGQEFVQ